ncbi:protein TRI1 [Camellia sinensis]|uniref:DM2 domain-containing protein n=1 Tax=Camellia sinensis TaxID=4442 RepID=A0A7J7H1V2_CAMSI|nr:protein TRI1 [Camellia sinensis]KAF5946555.1 hypothetical protein HYC85_016783 [Camellia sinensis]
MSSSSGVLKGCRALMAAAKAATPKSSAAKPKPKPKPKPKAVSKSSSSSKMARPTGILKLAPVSPALHQFLGVPEAARTDAVKKTWDYIKLHNLQNPTNKREICCDERLKTLFEGKDKVGFLEIGKLLSRHFVKTN